MPERSLQESSRGGACGTAVVLTPVGSISRGEDYVLDHNTEPGPHADLYTPLHGHPCGDATGPGRVDARRRAALVYESKMRRVDGFATLPRGL